MADQNIEEEKGVKHQRPVGGPAADAAAEKVAAREPEGPKLSQRDIFSIFLKAGLAFGGGLGILSVLEDELVTRRKIVTRDEFLAIYGIGRIVPSGTMTALAVAYGYRFGGWLGTANALISMALPAFALTIVLTMLYGPLSQGTAFNLIEVSVLPAALALIVSAALKLGKGVFRPSFDLILAAAGFAGIYFLSVNPAILLVAGGVLGIFGFRWIKR